MNKKLYLLILALCAIIDTHPKEINIFGDSHAFYSFASFYMDDFSKMVLPKETHFTYSYDKKEYYFNIYPMSGKTMFRAGRDKLDFLNIKKKYKLENSVIIFVFGEVDCRCHIGKKSHQLNQSPSLTINKLVNDYIGFIKLNMLNMQDCSFVVASVIPPSNMAYDPSYPYYGSLKDRAMITKRLNETLKTSCAKNNIIFFDIYHRFRDSSLCLIKEFSDRKVHVNPNINFLIKNDTLKRLNSIGLV